MGGLAKAKKVVQATMRHPTAKLLFNEAVDTTVLTDYAKIVSRPMDLGKILQWLSTDHYSSPREVGVHLWPVQVQISVVFERCLASMSSQ